MASTLVYDGDCGICQACVRWLERVGCTAMTKPSHEWLLTHPEDAERCACSVLLVTSDGTTLDAERAIAGALRLSSRPWPWVGAFIELPGVRFVAHQIYKLVARHRTRISGALGMNECSIADHRP